MDFVRARSLRWIEVRDGRSDVAGGEEWQGDVCYFQCPKHSVKDTLHTPVFLSMVQ